MDKLDTITQALELRLEGRKPKIGLVLGSGLNFFAGDAIAAAVTIPYGELPGFPVSTVEGHSGQFVAGKVGDVEVLCMQGRFHYYEGYAMEEVTLPIRVMKLLGIETLILTNAAGGVDAACKPGDLMLITDHINFIGVNPLRGPNDSRFGPRFHDMTTAWDPQLQQLARATAQSERIALKEGVYLAVGGPSFETPAEVRALRTLGAHAVGMSTVPECIVARHAGIRVLGFSCITNAAAGLNHQPLSHEEVGETAAKVREPFARLLKQIVLSL